MSKQLLNSVLDGTRCSEEFFHRIFGDKGALQSAAFIPLLALALEGSLGIEAIGMEAARVGIRSTFIYIYTIVPATDIFQFETNMTFAIVASKCVHTSSIVGTEGFIRDTFIDV